MAMALHGKNTHYKWQNIMPRHWFDESKRIDFPKTEMEAIIENTKSRFDTVLTNVTEKLPGDFPEHISTPVFDGMKKIAGRF